MRRAAGITRASPGEPADATAADCEVDDGPATGAGAGAALATVLATG